MQPEGSEVPVIHDVSRSLYARAGACHGLRHDRCTRLIRLKMGKLVYRISVQETARIYYHNLVDFYPHGPYLLLGHSAHGFFTLEVARLLIENGQNVAFLGLLDTFPPGYKVQVNLIDRVKDL